MRGTKADKAAEAAKQCGGFVQPNDGKRGQAAVVTETRCVASLDDLFVIWAINKTDGNIQLVKNSLQLLKKISYIKVFRCVAGDKRSNFRIFCARFVRWLARAMRQLSKS